MYNGTGVGFGGLLVKMYPQYLVQDYSVHQYLKNWKRHRSCVYTVITNTWCVLLFCVRNCYVVYLVCDKETETAWVVLGKSRSVNAVFICILRITSVCTIYSARTKCFLF